MLRIDLDRQLGQLQQEVISLAEIVDKATMRSVEALKQRDLTESQQLVQEDDYIDQKRYEIEDRCVDLIATQQPIAGDLRAIIALSFFVLQITYCTQDLGYFHSENVYRDASFLYTNISMSRSDFSCEHLKTFR